MTGLVADVGGTNTRLALVGADGVISGSVVKRANVGFDSFEEMAQAYLEGRAEPERVVVAVAGPVAGTQARLTNRNWDIRAEEIARVTGAGHVQLLNDLEALGHAVPRVDPNDVEPLHAGASLDEKGQALVVGLGTGFNVSPVDTRNGAVFVTEQGHASLPGSVLAYLQAHVPDVSAFETVEHLFSGVGLLHLGRELGLRVESAAELAALDDPKARAAVEICTDAFGLMLRELAYSYFPRAGFFFNGSLAKLLLSPERRARVLTPLRADARFDGQFARIPAFLFVSDTVALGGCAACLLRCSTETDIR